MGAYYFSNGDLNYNICTVNVPGPLAPGGSMSVSLPWTPSISGPPPGTVHACLKAEIVTPFDTDYDNNCAQHNINIQQTSSPAHFHLRVVNPTGLNITVALSNDLPAKARWTLEQSEKTFTMGAADCPHEVDLYLIAPGGGSGRAASEYPNLGLRRESSEDVRTGRAEH